jgi:Ca2+-binding RTX toxin-like protein
MFFDTLESRCLMSATITAPLWAFRPANRFNLTLVPAANVLNVVGTSGNDQIRITRTPTQLVVNVNGRGTFAPIASVSSIRVSGLAGHDRILIVDPAGKPANVDAGAGNDYISSGPGNDTLYGGDGRDWIQGNAGHDRIRGGAGDDILEGGAGNDILTGDAGWDRMFGQTGNDFFYAGDRQFDMVDGGIGTDGAQVDRGSPFTDGRNSIEFLV